MNPSAVIAQCLMNPCVRELTEWEWCGLRAGVIARPQDLPEHGDWLAARGPGTVASALAENGLLNWDAPPNLDEKDWWFRTSFPFEERDLDELVQIRFEGLATRAEAWLNGESILISDNMFCRNVVDVRELLQPENRLVVCFRSLAETLKARRPRPRWKTNLVAHQQLRWHRTSLAGRIPGWTPPAPAIGPWRPVEVVRGPVLVDAIHLQTRLAGVDGEVTFSAQVTGTATVIDAQLEIDQTPYPLEILPRGDFLEVTGTLSIADVPVWWPHTHGSPSLLDAELVLVTERGTVRTDCGRIGFRALSVDTGDGFGIRINGESVFCRGACWTLSDPLKLHASAESLRRDLVLARDAGINMLRVIGPLVPESTDFYRLCDELGILVWQDFPFANMDYPLDDDGFRASVTREAEQLLKRLSAHPSVAVYCGSSEIEQQAAMLGIPADQRVHPWFDQELSQFCARWHAGTTYVRSTPTGGVLPFQPDTGLTHYYGVGAYLRPVSDVRRSSVRFTPECLGFSNVPDAATVETILPGMHPVMHHPRWKARVPRDTGAGWDFEDVRDHYLNELFGVDPVSLRSRDPGRYLSLSRLVTGEMMAQVFSEWRRVGSTTQGALVWFYKDLWPAAGWGILDASGRPKAAYYFLKRVWAARQALLTDEGLNGLRLHLVNETPRDQSGSVEVLLLKEPDCVIARQAVSVTVPARGSYQASVEALLGGFYDVSYAYRFGPPQHDLAVATWFDESHAVIGQAFHRIAATVPALRSATLTLEAEPDREGVRVRLRSSVFLHGVEWSAPGFLPDDNYFPLLPDRERQILFRPTEKSPAAFKATLTALNLESSHTVRSTALSLR